MKKRREGKKNFSALIDEKKVDEIEKRLKEKNKTKTSWLQEKIDEELDKK